MSFNKNKVVASAQRYVQKGQLSRAIKDYLFVVEMDPDDTRVWLRIADLYFKMGAISNALQTYKRVAEYYGDKGFFAKGVAVYKNLLSIDPANLDAHLSLGEFYVQMGLGLDAIRQFQTVAATYARDGRNAEGLALLQRIVDLAPDNDGNRIRLAEAYARANKTAEAVETFLDVLSGLYDRGAYDEYVQVAERLIYLAPERLDIARQLSEVYLLKDDPKRALARLQTLFKSDPSDPLTLDLLGRGFAKIGQTHKAISVYRELARIHEVNGDEAARIGAFQAILALDPSDADARAAAGGLSAEHTSAPAIRAQHGTSIDEALSNEELGKRYLADAAIYRKYSLDGHAFDRLKAIFDFEPGNVAAAQAFAELGQEMDRADTAAEVLLRAADAVSGHDRERAMALLGDVLQLVPGHAAATERLRAVSAGMQASLPEEEAGIVFDDDDEVGVDDGFNVDLDLDEIEFDDGLTDEGDGLAFEMDPLAPAPDDDAFGDLLDEDPGEDEFADLLQGSPEPDAAAIALAPPAPEHAIAIAPPSDDFGDLLSETTPSRAPTPQPPSRRPPVSGPPPGGRSPAVVAPVDSEMDFGGLLISDEEQPAAAAVAGGDFGAGGDSEAGGDFEAGLEGHGQDEVESEFEGFDDFDDLLAEPPAQSAEFRGVLQEGGLTSDPPDDFGDLLAPDEDDDFGDLLASQGDEEPPEMASVLDDPRDDPDEGPALAPPLDEYDDDSIDADEATVALRADDLNLASLIAQTGGEEPLAAPRSGPPAPVPAPSAPPAAVSADLDDFMVGLGADQLENHGDLFDEVDRGTVDASDISEVLDDDSVAPPARADDLGDLGRRRSPAPISAPAQPMQFVGEGADAEPAESQETPNPISKPLGRRSLSPLARPSLNRTTGSTPLGPPKPPPPLEPRRRLPEPPPGLAARTPAPRAAPAPPPLAAPAAARSGPPAPMPEEQPSPEQLAVTPSPPAIEPESVDLEVEPQASTVNARGRKVTAESVELLDDDILELEDDDFDIQDYEEPDSLSGSIADSMASLGGASAPPASMQGAGTFPPASMPPPPGRQHPDDSAEAQSASPPDLDDSDYDDDDDDATIMGPIGGGFGLPPPPMVRPRSAPLDDEVIDETVALSVDEPTGGPTVEELAELDFLVESALEVDASDLMTELERKYGAHPKLAERRESLRANAQHDQHDELLDSIEANEADFATVAGAQLSDLSHDDAATHFDLGVAFKEMGQFAKALEQLEIAARSHERRTDALQLIALCHLESGHPDRGAETLVAALANGELQSKQRHDLQYDLATAYEQMGDPVRASQQLHAIVADVGDAFRDVKDRLARLG